MDLDWLKKISVAAAVAKRAEIEPGHPMSPVVRQCELPDPACSSFYYRSTGDDEVSLRLMRTIDEEFTRHQFYGERRMLT